MKSNISFSVLPDGRSVGSTSQSFTFSCISRNTFADLVPPSCLPRRPLNLLMLLSVPRVCIQTAMLHHETLPLLSHRATASVICSAAVFLTFSPSLLLTRRHLDLRLPRPSPTLYHRHRNPYSHIMRLTGNVQVSDRVAWFIFQTPLQDI